MIGLDTNVLVRYITQDDPEQAASASRIIESFDEDNLGFVSLVTLAELHWVLRGAYKISRPAAAEIFQKLLDAKELSVQQPDAARRALSRTASGADFADALISELGASAGCTHTVTFDERASNIPGMRLVDRGGPRRQRAQ